MIATLRSCPVYRKEGDGTLDVGCTKNYNIMGFIVDSHRGENGMAEFWAKRNARFQAEKEAEHKAWLANRFPKDQTIRYRGYELITNDHGYTWSIPGLKDSDIRGLREAKARVDAHYEYLEWVSEMNELAEEEIY